ncbi:hypothetical protein T12_1244 [Trichinella patagoniensis]|uniref:Uncharacterized protein n=1 Tax=Trichinella patagoniensis TaxID=990121 RepID=A0A0V0ZYJ9_9BILA|nr:hypothetical protein T12_1244 [Trichinella patagoniensis]
MKLMFKCSSFPDGSYPRPEDRLDAFWKIRFGPVGQSFEKKRSEARRKEKKQKTPPPPAFETGHTVRSGRSTRPPLRPTTPPA